MSSCGISLYFRNDRINIWRSTIETLENPAFVLLFINEQKKQLFIQSSERDKDAFRVYYKEGNKNVEGTTQGPLSEASPDGIIEENGMAVWEADPSMRPDRFYINAKSLLNYLAKVIGVQRNSKSLRYTGELLPDGKTIYIDLKTYEVIPYEMELEGTPDGNTDDSEGNSRTVIDRGNMTDASVQERGQDNG